MTIKEVIIGTNAYPISHATIEGIAIWRDIDINAEATDAVIASRAFKLAKADIMTWLSYAPNVSQGGQSYSFSEEQRTEMRAEAQALYTECKATKPTTRYGYKGSRL